MSSDFENELAHLVNRVSAENGSNTPDFILAQYLMRCLENFNVTVNRREMWYGRPPRFYGAPRNNDQGTCPGCTVPHQNVFACADCWRMATDEEKHKWSHGLFGGGTATAAPTPPPPTSVPAGGVPKR